MSVRLGSLGRSRVGGLPIWVIVIGGLLIGALVVIGSNAAGEAGVADRSGALALRSATVSVRSTGCGAEVTGSGVRLGDGSVLSTRRMVQGSRVQVGGDDVAGVAVGESLDVSVITPSGDRSDRGTVAVASSLPTVGGSVLVAGQRDGEVTVRRSQIVGAVAGRTRNEPLWSWRLDVALGPDDIGGGVADDRGGLVGIVTGSDVASGVALVTPVSAALGETLVAAVACP